MSFVRTGTGTTSASASGNESVQKFIEALQADFKTLSLETKKKYPQIKEVSSTKHFGHRKILNLLIGILFIPWQSCEEAVLRLSTSNTALTTAISSTSLPPTIAGVGHPQQSVHYVVNQILYPLVQGCETKDLKIIKVGFYL